MANNKYAIINTQLNQTNATLIEQLNGRQGDNGRIVYFSLRDGNLPHNISNQNISIIVKDAAGKIKIISTVKDLISSVGGLFSMVIPGELYQAAGDVEEAFIQVSDENNVVISSVPITFTVIANNIILTSNASKDYIDSINELFEQINSRIDPVNQQLTAATQTGEALGQTLINYQKSISDNAVITLPNLDTNLSSSSYLKKTGVLVDNYGAVGDGNADDTQAIQKAIDENPNARVMLTQGKTYNISQTIKANRNIVFDGQMASINLIANADFVFDFSVSGSTIRNVWIKKNNGVVASGVKISGNANILDNVQSRNCIWNTFIYAVDAKESHFSRIRVDNDTSNFTGSVFTFEHSINNTITSSFFGYCDTGILINDVAASTGHYTEGLMISDTTIVYTNTAVDIQHGTAINITNSILDFCANFGVKLHVGQMFTLSDTWIAIKNDNAVAIGVSDTSDIKFNEYLISNNMIVGDATKATQQAFNLPGNDIRVIANGNILKFINGGTIFSKNGSIEGNLVPNGNAINGYAKFTTKTHYPTNVATNFRIRNSIIELIASSIGSNNALRGMGNVDSSGKITLTSYYSNNITLGTIDQTAGSVSVVASDGNYTKMQLVTKVYPYDHLETK